MSWYAAHIVMSVRFKHAAQKYFPCWENIVLIEAATEEEAFAKAETHGREQAGDEDGRFRWDGKQATWVFAGVRKLVECQMMGNKPGDGDEISYSEMNLTSAHDVDRFAAGESVTVFYDDNIPAQIEEPALDDQTKRKKRA